MTHDKTKAPTADPGGGDAKKLQPPSSNGSTSGSQELASAGIKSQRSPIAKDIQETVTQNGSSDWDHPLPIPVERFHHINLSTGNPLPTLDNFIFMLAFYDIRITYNTISKRVEIIVPGLQGSPDNIDNAALAIVISLASLNKINSGNLMVYIGAVANQNSVNPIRDWMLSVPWDGNDRIDALIDTLHIPEWYSIHLKQFLVRRWLLSAAAAVLITGFHSRGVLTLQGPQSIGKTAWVAALLPPGMLRDRYIKLDHHLDPNNKDSILTAISHWIVEMGELESSFRRDMPRLKGFITAPSDKVRAPYARHASEYARRTVFIATVNSDQFLVDDTGNTRWWTVPVISIDYAHNIDMQQLWAQVAYLIQVEGEQWWLNPHEETFLEDHNRQFMRTSVITDLLDSEIDWDAPKEHYTLKSATEVLKMIGIDRPTNPQARECGSELRSRLGQPTKSQGMTRWRVPPALSTNTHQRGKR